MPEWTWEYEGYDPEQVRLREALCTLGNGYVATRGAAPECAADEVHYPGTYAAGCYNRLTSHVAGRDVENEDMVNLPNWLPLRFAVRPAGDPAGADPAAGEGHGDGTARTPRWFHPDGGGVLDHRLRLDLRGGTLERRMVCQDADGRRLTVRQLRLVHMGQPHLAALRTEFTAPDWSGELVVESALDGGVRNEGVARYRDLNGAHLTEVRTGEHGADTVWLDCRTTTSQIRIAQAARTTADPQPLGAARGGGPERATHTLRLPLTPGRTVTVDKTVALHTSRDPAVSDPLRESLEATDAAPGFAGLLDSHRHAWAALWARGDLEVSGEAGRILRLHRFHLLQTLSPHSAALDVGVPARGLHGEAYRGHVFWDELFILPYLNLHFPEISRGVLEYRHRRLGHACATARAAGRAGAQYPWQSGSDGREETQQLHLNPRSGRWLPDHSSLQFHVNSAIAYNVLAYAEASGDTEFLQTKGVEMLVQISRFWADAASWDERLGRYRIRGVMGPDEYHDAYPGADRPGLDDNAYTNVTAAWVIARTLDVLAGLPAPCRHDLAQAAPDGDELARWEDVSRRLLVPFHDGVISQFAGYGELAELDWEGYRARYGDIRRLDRVLEAEDDTVNRYRASKQADVLMLGYLFAPSELRALFRRLGHDLDEDQWRRTVEYYLRRTSHGSTLSGLVHGWVLARARHGGAWEYAREALLGDVADIQGGTTEEGIHLGAMAGTLDLVQRCLPGLRVSAESIALDPVPLPELAGYGFTVRYRDDWGVRFHMRPDELRVTMPASDPSPIRIELPGRSVRLVPGDILRLPLDGRDGPAPGPDPAAAGRSAPAARPAP